jgi:hypothetical protein
VDPDVTTRGEYREEYVAHLVASAAMDAARPGVRSLRRPEAEPVRHDVFEREALGICPGQPTSIFPDACTLIEVGLPIRRLPRRTSRGRQKTQQFRFESPQPLDYVVVQCGSWPVHDQLCSVCLDDNAEPAEVF